MNKTGKLAIAFLFLVGGVLALVTAAVRSRREEPVSLVPLSTEAVKRDKSAEWLTEFTLTQQNGKEFRSADLAGTPHVVNFFFASCPSYCRMQSTEVQKLAAEFGPQGVLFLSITCDPDNDTPAALQQYASMFNANTDHWKFLTGDMLLLRRIGAEMYEVPVDKQTHSEHLIVVDKWGKIRGRFRWQKHPEELAELKELLPKLVAETVPTEPPAEPELVIDEETGLLIEKPQSAEPGIEESNSSGEASAAGDNPPTGSALTGPEVTPGAAETGSGSSTEPEPVRPAPTEEPASNKNPNAAPQGTGA